MIFFCPIAQKLIITLSEPQNDNEQQINDEIGEIEVFL